MHFTPSRSLRLRALAAGLAFTLALTPAAAQVRLPALGETAGDELSVAQERRVGDQIMREARRDPAYLDDPVLLEYVQGLWQPLLTAARESGQMEADLDRQLAWELILVRDRSVNAFALPGGYVGVHLGLIALTTQRDQLASVLAHELAHVTQRHIARSVGNSSRASMVTLAAVLLGILAASRSNNADAANAAIATGQAAGIQQQLNFSRDMEREADRVGFAMLADAGFATSGMAQMFEKLDLASRLNDSGGFPYLRSHPLTVDRISEARNRVLLSGGGTPAPSLMHALMQQRARVLMDSDPQALARLAAGASSSPVQADRIAALYGGALAQGLLNQPAKAEALATEGRRAAAAYQPADADAERAFALLLVQSRISQGDAPGALALLMPYMQKPGRATLLMHARATLAWHQRDAAAAAADVRRSTEALHTWVAGQPQDAQAWELLAASAQALGQRLRSMRAEAESRGALGDLTGAIDRLRAAQAASRGAQAGQEFIEASVIDARLRHFERERRQLALEMRAQRGGGSREPGDGAPPDGRDGREGRDPPPRL
jgi:beta-barrel assembly-enhancing protease